MSSVATNTQCNCCITTHLLIRICTVHAKDNPCSVFCFFFILQKTEAWEAEKTVADMEEYSWEESPSQKNLLDILVRMKVAGEGEGEEVREQLLGRREVQEYKDSVTRLKNEGDSDSTMLQYKEAVKKVFNL